MNTNNKKWQSGSFLLPFYTSLLTILLSMVCLAGASWAWFTANETVTVDPIISANWEVETLQITTDDALMPIMESGSTFSVQANTPYTVTASVQGNASTGFLKIETCDGVFYTTERETTFTLLLSRDSDVTITASWGMETGDAEEFSRGDILGYGNLDSQTSADPMDPISSADPPVYDEPVYDEPVYDEPVYDEPVYDEPLFDDPASGDPLAADPLAPPSE